MALLVNDELEDEKMFEGNRSSLILDTVLNVVWRNLVKPRNNRHQRRNLKQRPLKCLSGVLSSRTQCLKF